ncbi:MAG: hypothetical protein ACK4GL_07065 [Flavobacteriales bacterium]
MTPLLKKLNFKNQKQIFVCNAPDDIVHLFKSFPEKDFMTFNTAQKEIEFAIVFVLTQQEINEYAQQIIPQLKDDAVFWMCYPKSSSKKYVCDFNRDKGWDVLGKYNVEGVRQVAIDENWSALRFRKVQYISKLTRKFDTLSEQGKIKSGQTKSI